MVVKIFLTICIFLFFAGCKIGDDIKEETLVLAEIPIKPQHNAAKDANDITTKELQLNTVLHIKNPNKYLVKVYKECKTPSETECGVEKSIDVKDEYIFKKKGEYYLQVFYKNGSVSTYGYKVF